jgi:hypothetical protein
VPFFNLIIYRSHLPCGHTAVPAAQLNRFMAVQHTRELLRTVESMCAVSPHASNTPIAFMRSDRRFAAHGEDLPLLHLSSSSRPPPCLALADAVSELRAAFVQARGGSEMQAKWNQHNSEYPK